MYFFFSYYNKLCFYLQDLFQLSGYLQWNEVIVETNSHG